MTDEKKPIPPRIVDGTYYRDNVLMGPLELIGSTKHGTTTLLAVEDESTLEAGDKIKTKSFVLNAREFVVLAKHTKPMKISGVWYEVRPVADPKKAETNKPVAKKVEPKKAGPRK